MTDPIRNATLALLCDVTDARRMISEAAPERLASLRPEGRAAAQRLATGTLRWADRADRVLGPFLRRRPSEATLNALRLGLFEIFVAGTAPHAAVDGAVDAARTTGGQPSLVNAVLRNILRLDPEPWSAAPVPRLPKWLRKPLVAAWGKQAVAAMEDVFAAEPPLDLTVRADAPGWAARLGGELLPTGSVRLRAVGQVSALPGFAEGAWWVQDAAAAIPARLVGAGPGMRVLDMCAAPGGKTLQLTAAGADVTALDQSEARTGRLRENLARCGLEARVVVGDALTHEDAPFDAILLDAPCTATGTIRRHPDLPHVKAGQDLDAPVALQARLIDRALGLLKPGGRLVYCVCSLLPAEGEEQIAAALARHPGLSAGLPETLPDGIEPDWRAETGLRLRPDHWAGRGGIDGFFIATLTMRGDAG
ncbi:methyltransferase domain-containing protein [Palleronia sediminis]|uniref:Methyltransferase domain-containing protein n=1 Tax=Palleronia sediminis TaxID=2547833 RepID=A0A4R6A5H4_9RHOB|nr:transcription antitermination factor NusB [Palleronia sediminis]TDL76013.1 methyltransferase domain-containing protein [Palleronia sediminis]